MLRRRQHKKAEVLSSIGVTDVVLAQKASNEKLVSEPPKKLRLLQPAWVDEDESEDDSPGIGNNEGSKIESSVPAFLSLTKASPESDSEASIGDDDVSVVRRFSVLPTKSTKKKHKTGADTKQERNDVSHFLTIGGSSSVSLHRPVIANKDACPPSRASLSCVRFHPILQDALLMTTSLDGSLQLFNVDSNEEEDSNLLHSHIFPKLRIASATFANKGDSVYVVGLGTIQVYDMTKNVTRRFRPLALSQNEHLMHITSQPLQHNLLFATGRQGRGYLLDCRTDEIISSVAVESDIRATEFAALDNLHVAAGGGNYIYDVRKFTSSVSSVVLGCSGHVPCLGKWSDPGLSLNGAFSMAVSGDGISQPEWLACGSAEGYVHVYKYGSVMGIESHEFETSSVYETCAPALNLPHLKTVTDSLSFHPSHSLLAYASSKEPRALRLFDINKRKIVTFQYSCPSPIVCMDFSEKHFAVGSRNGSVLMFKCHFQ